MLSRLRQISRRIGLGLRGEGGGKLAAKSASKSGSGSGSKSGSKPSSKAAGKAVPKTPAKAAGKPVAKVAAKPVSKPAAKAKAAPAKKAPAVSAKKQGTVAAKAPAKAVPKAVAKAPVKTPPPKAAAKTAEKPQKATKPVSAKTGGGKTETLSSADFEGAEQFAADIASDMEAAELEVAVEPEALSPSAALLAVMKPTVSDEKAAEKKKKKDDLKIDRNGDLEAQWQTLKDKNKALKPVNYKMSESFEARTPILHKVLGWGFIISNQNDRLEILFQQGIKFLISNYKV